MDNFQLNSWQGKSTWKISKSIAQQMAGGPEELAKFMPKFSAQTHRNSRGVSVAMLYNGAELAKTRNGLYVVGSKKMVDEIKRLVRAGEPRLFRCQREEDVARRRDLVRRAGFRHEQQQRRQLK